MLFPGSEEQPISIPLPYNQRCPCGGRNSDSWPKRTSTSVLGSGYEPSLEPRKPLQDWQLALVDPTAAQSTWAHMPMISILPGLRQGKQPSHWIPSLISMLNLLNTEKWEESWFASRVVALQHLTKKILKVNGNLKSKNQEQSFIQWIIFIKSQILKPSLPRRALYSFTGADNFSVTVHAARH